MREKTLLREFAQYAALNICGMIGLSCYILADTFFISRGLGAGGLAALNLAIPIYSFVNGSGLMFGMGGATKYSICMGQGEEEKGSRIYTNALYAVAVSAVLFVGAGVFFPGNLALAMGADEEIFAMTKTYLQVILLFSPAFMANDIMICFVRNDGNPRLSMTAMLAGSLSNIVMDYIFIFPLHMGIFGAVLATGFAPVISLGILFRHWRTKRNRFHLVRTAPSLREAGSIISLGIPALISEVASGIVIIVFNVLILNLQGNTGVAAYGVVANLSLVVTSVYTGIAQGMQPVISRLYGRRDGKSIRQVLKYAVILMFAVSGVIYLFFAVLAGPVAGIFNSGHDRQLQQIAETGLRLYFTAAPFAGFNIVISTYFTSTEKALPGQIVSLSRGFLVIIPMAFFMAFLLGMTGVWLSYPLAEGMVAAAGIVLYKNCGAGCRRGGGR